MYLGTEISRMQACALVHVHEHLLTHTMLSSSQGL
jgi:hypothetical protein